MGELDRYGNYRIKKSWRKWISGDAISVLIASHVIAFVFFLLVLGIYKIAGANGYQQFIGRFALPDSFKEFLFQPWSIFTYSITEVYSNFFRLLSNMVWLFFYAQILKLYTRDAVIIPIFIYGTILGALGFLVFSAIPGLSYLQNMKLFGAHNGIIALAMAATFIAPSYKILPQIRGGISLWIVTLIYLLLNVGSVAVVGTGYGVGLLLAASAGAAFSLLLKRNTDITDWLNNLWQRIGLIFERQKRTPAKEVLFYKTGKRVPYNKEPIVTPSKIDELLDKISEKGYNALTEKEKEILRKHAEGNNN